MEMATSESNDLQFSVVSIVEDVLQQHGTRSSDVCLAPRKVEESSLRRYEAAGWLRRMAGVIGGRDMPAEPDEEDFRLALRSGIILCNVLNKINPGSVPKVVEAPSDSADGAALSAFQYFENIRNFLVAVEEMGLPSFEASDLEKGGKSARIVNCVLALKSYDEWKQNGGIGSWRYGMNIKPNCGFGRPFLRKTSEPFMSSISRTKSADSSLSDQPHCSDLGQELNEGGDSRSINALVRSFLSDRKSEEIPTIVESMLNKVMEEFERRLSIHSEMMKTSSKHPEDDSYCDTKVNLQHCVVRQQEETEEDVLSQLDNEKFRRENSENYEEREILLKQQRFIQELKQSLNVTKAGMQLLQMKYQEEFSNLGKHLHGLAYAATGYKRVLEENRKLYNLVQDLKGNIRVYCRVRPFLSGQPNVLSTVDHMEEGTITIRLPAKYGKEGRKLFTFNKVFSPSATQEEVFSDMQPLIRSVLDGYNVCIFAYGQTGSGKTYTMTGPKELTEEGLGVNYRALADLFLLSSQRKDTICYDISVQMLEIYNEQVRDLLAPDGQNRRLEIRNNSHNGLNVPEANLVPVSSTSDVIHLMDLGQKNRAVSATAMNDRSSRSHSCLTVHVQGRDLTSGATLHGSMHLVDLAGSERVDKSEVTGDRLKEAQHINKSLSALGDVISSLSQKNAHVPYRNSKLTQLLQDSLGGSAKTLMFVHISPEADTLGETISTLKFAERVGSVELGAARVNKDNSEVKELKEQIASLRMALARKEGESPDVQTSISGNRDRIMRRRSLESPSPRPKLASIVNLPSSHKQQTEDLSGSEIFSDSTSSRRHSLDLHEITQSPSMSWPSPSLDAKDDEGIPGSGDWIDKAILNKLEESFPDEHPDSPEKFYRPEPPLNNGGQDFGGQSLTDIESDEGRASDCSDSDLMWQLNVQVNVPRVSNIPVIANSRAKKTPPRNTKTQETRNFIPSLIPPPTRKPPSTVTSQLQRPRTQRPGSRTGHGK
ncbi:PREDICTED: kinesin-like protein KIN-14G [Tarenaya hassleriana]|uniref:kinesin-like protein KIN-14G n=1 Tax=Tarenaya hassleriana TaxID=28532 RepID=UPI00053C63E0|nr:PREDICTED: kinesin-like protein KIN-14G [Tarenaya hassleriana]